MLLDANGVKDVYPSFSAMSSVTVDRTIAFLVFDGFQILDLAGPLSVFELANARCGRPAYDLQTVSQNGGRVCSSAGLMVETATADQDSFDTVVVVGGDGSFVAARDPVHAAMINAMSKRTRRMASVCTGAFVLASAALLEGKRVTTHWRHASALQGDNLSSRVEPDRIFVQDGCIWSSAGVTAGIDLALALVEDDLGFDASRAVAQELVIYQRRPGGQSQFSAMLELEPSSDRIRRALIYAREHLTEPLTVAALAEVAALSERQFTRAFRMETGETPARAVERLRVEAARVRLESGRESVELVCAAVGFFDAERMRRAFLRVFGEPPQALRRAARMRDAASHAV